MSRRAASRDETRNRIVEATARLHGERGVLGTSWQDIAREADVSVSTVYAHFPSLEDLLPACGQLVMSRARPPSAGDVDEIIGDASDTHERLLRVARALFSFYERGGPHIEVDIRERRLPGMREWEESQRATVLALVRAALVAAAPAPARLRAITAFFDLPTYKALRTRGVSTRRAAETVAEVALGLAAQRPAARSGGES
jgi:AcrR family transcriptional regulator